MATIFPPLIDYKLPLVLGNNQLIINYTIPGSVNINSIEKNKINYQIKNINTYDIIAKGLSNSSILDLSKLYEEDKKLILGNWYGIQIAFVLPEGSIDTAEWSTVAYFKKAGILSSFIEEDSFSTEAPLFTGIYSAEDNTETIEYYQFKLYDSEGTTLLNDSGKKITNNNINTYIFEYNLSDKRYYIEYIAYTKNGGIVSSGAKQINKNNIYLEDVNISLGVTNNEENGSIDLSIQSSEFIAENFMIRRASSIDNFGKWIDLAIINFYGEAGTIYTYQDCCTENGISYQYGVQLIDINGYRGSLFKTKIIKSQFEYNYIFDSSHFYCLKFNNRVNNYRRNLSESLVTTIGSKYPFYIKSGDNNYFSYSMDGLISYYMNNIDYGLGTNLTYDNYYQEKKFRDEFEAFMTNGQAKFIKSPSEGLKVVIITGMSLSPQESLGRMIYDFSCTVTEIADNEDFNLIKTLNLIKSDELIDIEEFTETVGEYAHTYEQNIEQLNLFEFNFSSSDKYNKKLKFISNFKIELPENAESDAELSVNNITIIIPRNYARIYQLNDNIKITDLIIKSAPAGTTIVFNGIFVYTNLAKVVKYQDKEKFNFITVFPESNILLKDNEYISYLRIDTNEKAIRLRINNEEVIIKPQQTYELNDIKITSFNIIENTSTFLMSYVLHINERVSDE